MKLLQHLVFLLCSPFMASCVYLHSDALQKTAEQAQVEFQTITSNPPYSSYLSKHAAQVAITERVFRSLHEGDVRDFLDTLPSLSWEQLISSTEEVLKNSKEARETAEESRDKARGRLKLALEKLPSVEQNLTDIANALTEASKAEARFKATQDLLRLSLLSLVDSQRSDAFKSISTLLDEKRPYIEYILKNTKITSSEKTTSVKEILSLSDIADLLTKQPKSFDDVKPLLEKLFTLPTKLPGSGLQFTDPGIASTIIGLGLDFARAEELRVRAEIDTANEELQLLDSKIALLSEVIEILGRKRFGIPALKGIMPDASETIHQTVDRLVLQLQAAEKRLLAATGSDFDTAWKERNKVREKLLNLLVLLATNFRVRVVQEEKAAILSDQEANLEADRALRFAAANLQEREAVISRGLEGLVAFHQGGISSEDVSRVIGIAQAIGIAVIAGEQ